MGEQPNEPEGGGENNTPDDGEIKPHEHEYKVEFLDVRDAMLVHVSYKCECGEDNTDVMNLLVVHNGDSQIHSLMGKHEFNYSNLKGTYDLVLMDNDGNVYDQMQLVLGGEEPEPEVPTKPSEPEQPENPDNNIDSEEPDVPSEPETPNEPDNSGEGETPNVPPEDDTDKPTDVVEPEKSNSGLITGIIIVLGLLAAGGIVTLFIIKKKRNKK